jgi:predicted phage terminase large subunit-like protein
MLVTYNRDTYDRISRLNLSVHGAGDWACSDEDGANPTCFGGSVMDEDGILYILPDIFWKVAAPDETVTQFIEFLKRRNPLNFWSEKGQISKSWGPFLRKQMIEENVHCHITEVTPSHAKDVRAQSIRGRMSLQRVRFPEFATWWEAAKHQMLTFPGGKNDDFVDFIAHLGMGINSITKSQKKTEPQEENLNVPWKPTFGWLKNQEEARKRSTMALYQGR